MGNLFSSEPTFPIKVFCFGNQNGILQEIFPEKIENKDKDNWDHRKLKKSESIPKMKLKKLFPKLLNGKQRYILILQMIMLMNYLKI